MAKEQRLIDADVLVRDINADPYRTESEKSYDRCLVHRQPTVDAVEVVRCKNCVHYNGEGCLKTYGEFEPEPTFYCAYGERRGKDAVD